MPLLSQLFALFWKAFFDALLEHLPAVTAWWKTINTSTQTDAPPVPVDLDAALKQEIADAQK